MLNDYTSELLSSLYAAPASSLPPTTVTVTSTPTSTPIIMSPGELAAPVVAGVTVALLFLFAVLVAVMIIGLLWIRRRRKMKEASRAIPLELASW